MTRHRSIASGLATMLASGTATQLGAGLGAHAFPALGPAGVVAVRQIVAAAVLVPAARPRPLRFTRAQWWPTVLLGLVFATMNLSLYGAVARVGLGLAVTLEFLGPLAVALAGSRSRTDLACAVGAGAGVVVLVLPGPTSDWVGIGLGLLAAAGWAAYILLNRVVGARLPGLAGPAVASSIATLVYLPVAAVLAVQGRLVGKPLVYAVCTGLLCSVVPYAADLIVLRRVPAQFFGVAMSVNPVLAALAGTVVLGQALGPREWVGILVVVAANAVAAAAGQRRSASASYAREVDDGETACEPLAGG